MQDSLNWVPSNVDVERPNEARLYDYFLGGAHNFAVDRRVGEWMAGFFPSAEICRHTRAFLRRAVRLCLAAGIRQFLDLGSGLPTAGNVHQVAREVDQAARVVYVDRDPVTVAHARAMLKADEHTAVVRADLRDHRGVLHAPETRRLLDFTQPVAVLLVGVLHYLSDADDPDGVIAGYRAVMAPGSMLVLAHLDGPASVPEAVAPLAELARQNITTAITPRCPIQITRLMRGLELLEPGVVAAARWRTDQDDWPAAGAAPFVCHVAVGRKGS
ncbi:SAM-dependent methyltransferase [Goodfellowiella coeruleoviolacea]|uniref:S-adenosyl methyltransferase n=1 Tax=Goodfellowiella coeruleoviolacea TaxID=334858 RepID=A0AAE3KIH6_9PSEU|nr:SAM-dependent methyltransferase [Goodfellowiella coeruleoviolacea]MCP2167992.1 S-adenosyl methyltransferase [Goodfellowiella coeruleoviolacea]